MNDPSVEQLERQLAGGQPGGAPAELRARVLADVSRELRAASWDRRLSRLAAAVIVAGIGINAATALAPGEGGRGGGGPVARASVVQTAVEVARATDLETGRQVGRQLAALSGASVTERRLAELDAAIAANVGDSAL